MCLCEPFVKLTPLASLQNYNLQTSGSPQGFFQGQLIVAITRFLI